MRTMVTCCMVTLLAACAPGWQDRDGWVMEGALDHMPAHPEYTLQAAGEVRPCTDFRWGGWVIWMPGPFDCAGVTAAGCYSGAVTLRAEVMVTGTGVPFLSPEHALAHELAHYILDRCYGDISESERQASLTSRIARRAQEIEAAAAP